MRASTSPPPAACLPRTLDYLGPVAVVRGLDDGRAPVHTHSAQPVRLALAECREGLPALVLGDHGWLCGAGRLGIPAAGLADSNDPAPFVAEAEGTVAVAVPVDDGAYPACYKPLSDYVLQQADLAPYKD